MPRHPLANSDIDTTAKFESMRGVSKNAQIMRRHTDLKREYDQQIRTLETETRHSTTELTRAQFPYKKKLMAFEDPAFGRKYMSKFAKFQNKHQVQVAPPKLQRQKKDVLLFRIEKRDGKVTYIKEAEKPPNIDEMFASQSKPNWV